MPRPTGRVLVAQNKKARHDYEIGERFEAGLVLTGTEVKSLRGGGDARHSDVADHLARLDAIPGGDRHFGHVRADDEHRPLIQPALEFHDDDQAVIVLARAGHLDAVVPGKDHATRGHREDGCAGRVHELDAPVHMHGAVPAGAVRIRVLDAIVAVRADGPRQPVVILADRHGRRRVLGRRRKSGAVRGGSQGLLGGLRGRERAGGQGHEAQPLAHGGRRRVKGSRAQQSHPRQGQHCQEHPHRRPARLLVQVEHSHPSRTAPFYHRGLAPPSRRCGSGPFAAPPPRG